MYKVKKLIAALMCGIMCVTSANIPAFAEPAEVDLTQNVEMENDAAIVDDTMIDVSDEQYTEDMTQDTPVSEKTQDMPVSENVDETAPDVGITSNVTPNVDEDITQTSDMGRYVKDRTVTATCNGITVYVKGMLPYKTSLSVRPVNRYKQANYEAVIDGQDADITREVITVLDIKLINEYGEEFEPDDTMQVTFAGGDVEDGVSDSEKEIEVYHVVDDAINYTGSNATEKSFQAMKTEDVEASGVTFATDSFSEYVVVLKEGSTTQKEVKVDTTAGKEKGFELDKYITKTGEQKNGNDSYIVTLEHAYYNNEVVGPAPLPEPQDVIVIFDQSASMSGRVGKALEGLNKFYEAIRDGNVIRRQKWTSGMYDVVDKNNDFVDDITGEKLADHLITMRAVIGYNYKVYTKWSGNMILETQAQIDTLNGVSKCAEIYMQPYGPAPEGYGVMDMTRTDLAIARAASLVRDGNHANTTIVLATDGEPYGNGNAGDLDYDTGTVSELMMTFENTNRALSTARSLKDKGTTIYSIFMYTRQEALPAVEAGLSAKDIHAIGNDDKYLGIKFLSLFSSDYPKNGQMGGGGTFDGSFTSGKGKFGQYAKYPYQAADIARAFDDTGRDITLRDGSISGYFNATSYSYDEISHPFTYDATNPIQVYQVPRIATAKGVFEWGEPEEITNQVVASVDQGRFVTVKGYNYENNAVSEINKKSGRTGFVETFPSAPGEYGYKLVVKFGIMSNENFGGNNIETNNSETSGFFPSRPTGGYIDGKYIEPQPDWEENKTLNPEGHDYIELYPVPHVDLNINYKIVSDNINIYAPQTAKLKNLITDNFGSIFFTDEGYGEAKTKAELAKLEMEKASALYIEKGKEVGAAETDDARTALMKELVVLQKNYDDARIAYEAAQDAFDSVQSYIPDGDKNAYVDIAYTLKDPDGKVIGTMNIPHGFVYEMDDKGVGNLDWNLTDGADALITKSGKYTITATITPVTTTREESHTGSSATGSQKQTPVTANAEAYIYVLEITAADTRLEKGQAIDMYLGANNVQNLIENSEDKHLVSMRWVCTDGKTPSIKENEPGYSKVVSVGGNVQGTITVPNQKDYIKDVSGTYVVNVNDGEYIPVAVSLYRTGANINKDASPQDAVNLVTKYMRDDDKLYGSDSSVRWVHDCDIVTDCDKFEFNEAKKLNQNGTAPGAQNNVRYLIHVLGNPLPVIHKTTSTPVILRTEDIKWTINITNNDIEKNPKKYASVFTMVDALPWKGDERYDDFYADYKGSQFSGTLKYKTIVVDCSKDTSALKTLKFYTTTDTDARSDEKLKIDKAKWTVLNGTTSGNKITYSIPDTAIAVRLDAQLPFNEQNGGGITIDMTANVKNTSQQEVDDTYINQASVFNEFNMVESEPVRTQVLSVFIDGRVWVDTNGNGIRENADPTVKNVKVGLYKAHNPSGAGEKYTITINGTQYDRAYDADEDLIGIYNTEQDGTYRFDNLNPDTYYVVAENIDGIYSITKKNVGTDKTIDSDADVKQPKASTAFINDIKISPGSSGRNYDIGLIERRGSVKINKSLDDIYYPVAMTQQQRDDYFITATFTLTSNTGQRFINSIMLSPKNHLEGSITFKDLPFGIYTLTETAVGNYQASNITASSNRVTIDLGKRTCTIPINETESDYTVTYTNKLIPTDYHGDQHAAVNHVPMHVPVSLEIKYVGANPVGNSRLSSYTFKESDFDPKKGGDMIVTYDDGSTISLSAGTLKYNQVSLAPGTVTNMDNSSKNSAMTISGYYSEKGRTLTDNFKVVVNLKPIHKFSLTFDTNGGTFPAGTTSSTRNVMRYGYDEAEKKNYAISGVYKEPNTRANYTFAGWNTANDGSGKAYNNETALNAIGADNNVSNMTLYAHWKTNVTFNANGGTLSTGGTTQTVPWSVNAPIADGGRTAKKNNHAFFGWNTKADGTGTWLDKYGKVTQPVTFYAILCQTEFPYNGTNGSDGSVQTFKAPFSGTYKLQVWGPQGASQATTGGSVGGCGGYSEGTVHLNAGQTVYVFVGGRGNAAPAGTGGGGWNGGGHGHSTPRYTGYGGGGMTHMSLTNNLATHTSWNPEGTLLVAGGGGGADNGGGSPGGHDDGSGGYGGGLSGGPGLEDGKPLNMLLATQTSGYAQGRGMDCTGATADAGGGGAGWYGGMTRYNTTNAGGGGGSGYIGGVQNGKTIAGNQVVPTPSGGTSYGNVGNGYARITPIKYD